MMSPDAREAVPFLPTIVRKARSRAAGPRAAGTRCACGSVMPSPRRTPAQWHGGATHFLQTSSPLATAFFRTSGRAPGVPRAAGPSVADLAPSVMAGEQLRELLAGGVDRESNVISVLVETVTRLVVQQLLEAEQPDYLGGRVPV